MAFFSSFFSSLAIYRLSSRVVYIVQNKWGNVKLILGILYRFYRDSL